MRVRSPAQPGWETMRRNPVTVPPYAGWNPVAIDDLS